MGSISAGASFYRLDGPVGLARLQYDQFRRAGVAGTGFQLVGMYGDPFRMVGSASFTTAQLRAEGIAYCTTLIGSLVQVTGDDGVAWNNIMVLDAQPVEQFHTVGLTYSYFVRIEFLLQSCSTTYTSTPYTWGLF